jgi:DNA-binding transcriptional MerR regulator
MEELTVEELSAETGISVRNLRFYTTRGLVPPPTKRGRTAVYGSEHVARFSLLRDLQAHGLNLAAIERYFEGIPADATAEQIALQQVTLRPFAPAESTDSTRAALIARGIPTDLIEACEDIYRRHSTAMAGELEALFRKALWPGYKAGEMQADQLVAMLDNWEQDGAVALVEAFGEAITEARRAIIARRTAP